MKKRLLILGSLREFVQLIETAKARGYYTIVVDGYRNSEGKAHADKSYDIPPGNISEIAGLCRREQVDGIITSFSDYLFECMVKIAAEAGLKCYFSPEKLELYRNKYKMKEMLLELGIATPRFTMISPDFPDSALKDFSFPVVVKPLDKYGSRGVLVLDSPEQIREQFSYVCETSEIKKLLVEEYHDGYEFNMMTWVVDGQVQVLSLADREKTPTGTHDIPVSTRNVYPSRLLDSVIDEAREVLQKVVNYTNQNSGALSMQFFWKPGCPVSVCEIAGRFFGYEHELVEYCSGLAMEDLLLDYVYDESNIPKRLLEHSPRFSNCCAVLYFHGKNGMLVEDQTKADALSALPGVKEYWSFYKKGEQIVSHGKNPYVTRYYITCKDRREADRLTQEIFEQIKVLSPAGENILYQNKIPEYPE